MTRTQTYRFAHIALIMAIVFSLFAVVATPTQAAAPQKGRTGTGVSATVKVAHLNVRRAPRVTSSILGVLNLGDVVPVIGRNVRYTWLQVNTQFGTGWIASALISTDLEITVLPVTENNISPFVTITAVEGAYLRLGPFLSYPILDLIPYGTELDIVAVHSKGTWIEVATFDGKIGWIEINQVLITGSLKALAAAELNVRPLAEVVPYRLRVHTLPDVDSPGIAVIRQRTLYTIIGQDAKGLYWKIVGPFGSGWVAAEYVNAIGYLSEVPVLAS